MPQESALQAKERQVAENMEDDILDAILEVCERSITSAKVKAERIRCAAEQAANLILADA